LTTVHTVLARCRDLGVTIIPTERGTLKVQAEAPLPEDLRNTLKRHKQDILAEVTRRVAVFRNQAEVFIREGRALPILTLSEHQGRKGCISCGSSVDGGGYRCAVCALAVKLALEEYVG